MTVGLTFDKYHSKDFSDLTEDWFTQKRHWDFLRRLLSTLVSCYSYNKHTCCFKLIELLHVITGTSDPWNNHLNKFTYTMIRVFLARTQDTFACKSLWSANVCLFVCLCQLRFPVWMPAKFRTFETFQAKGMLQKSRLFSRIPPPTLRSPPLLPNHVQTWVEVGMSLAFLPFPSPTKA